MVQDFTLEPRFLNIVFYSNHLNFLINHATINANSKVAVIPINAFIFPASFRFSFFKNLYAHVCL